VDRGGGVAARGAPMDGAGGGQLLHPCQ
jgi:hypothetical protein